MSQNRQYEDDMINFDIGQPNNSILPIDWFREACSEISSEQISSDFLQYGEMNGNITIRNKLANWLSNKYDNNITADQLFMTNGCTGALHLLFSKYSESGDTILVDNPSDFLTIDIFEEYGFDIERIDFNSDGVDIEMMDEKITKLNSDEKYRQGVLFYYTSPTYHNPTGVTISNKKRKLLAKLCDKHKNLFIIANEENHFISWDDSDYLPLADYHPKIISICSFSKILAPALRVGWIYQNTSLENYKDEYSFISGSSGLNHSCVLKASGGLNPIGYKFVEHVLDVDCIDGIIESIVGYLETNCTIMLEYMEQFNNIVYTKPKGGYYIWLKFKNINDTSEFLKYCEKSKVRFHPGMKFSDDNMHKSFIRLSFSYYNPSELITGLERLMDCVTRYNHINVMICGENDIRKHIMANDDMIIVNDITQLSPFNSVIVDLSDNTETSKLLQQLIRDKYNIPLIIGMKEIDDDTKKLIKEYQFLAPVTYISNFSDGYPLFVEFKKLANQLNQEWNITSQTNKSIELTNGSETITLVHNITDSDTYAKVCINYIYWILNCNNGYYSKMTNNIITIDTNKFIKLHKELPLKCYNHMIETVSNNSKINDIIVSFRNTKNNSFDVKLYKKETKLVSIDYDMLILSQLAKYINENYDMETIRMKINNITYDFKYTENSLWVELPSMDYVKNSNESIQELISMTTNILLLGICRYNYNDSYYLILEVQDCISFSSKIRDLLETITTLINCNMEENNESKYNIVFLNNNGTVGCNMIDIKCFNTMSVETTDDYYSYVSALEYYLYHFHKDYDRSLSLTINMKNKVVEMVYENNSNYIILSK